MLDRSIMQQKQQQQSHLSLLFLLYIAHIAGQPHLRSPRCALPAHCAPGFAAAASAYCRLRLRSCSLYEE